MMREQVKHVNRVWMFAVLAMLGASVLVGLLGRWIEDEGLLLMLNQVIIFLPSLIYLLWRGNIAETIGIRRIPLVTVPLLVLLMILFIPLISLLNVISMFFAENLIGVTAEQILSGHSLALSIVMIALVPAIFEEILFRGIVYHDGYRQVNPVKGALLCGLMFGLLHMNLNQFMYAFVLGAVLCIVLEATGSILATMIMHFTLNSYSMVMLHLSNLLAENEQIAEIIGEIGEDAEMTPEMLKDTLLSILPVAVAATVLAFVLLRKIAKICGREEHLQALFTRRQEPVTTWEAWDAEERKPGLITVAWVIGALLCIGMMVLVQISGNGGVLQ